MKLNKLLTTLAVVAPVAAIVPAVTSCNQMSQEAKDAQEYIKDRTFAICGFKDSKPTAAGTGWILSDSTPTVTTDYKYYIATNWHVKYQIEDKLKSTAIYYHTDEMQKGLYKLFKTTEWYKEDTEATQYCFTDGDKKTAIDFYILEVDFGTDLDSATKAKLDKLNTKQAKDGYINKFAKSTASSNFEKQNMYCGGYPAVDDYQTWKFEQVNGSNTEYRDKTTKDLGHGIDNNEVEKANIVDISPQYMTTTDHGYRCKEATNTEYVPINWSLTAGSSGSMLVTKQSDEFVVTGIYWGGINYQSTKDQSVWFCPCWSVFKSDKKDFTENL